MERPVPPPGEEIHLPGPSLQPLLVAVGITLALIGVTFAWWLVAAGTILTVWTIVRWVADVRRDIEELPLEAPHH
jgi:hypothetical protein